MQPGWIPSMAAFLAALLPASFLAGQEAVVLHPPSAGGEPGEEVAIEFRADIPQPVIEFALRVDLGEFPPARLLRAEVQGTASGHVSPRGVIVNADHRFGGFQGLLLGVKFDTQYDAQPLQPGSSLAILRAVVRIDPRAAAGEYPIAFGTCAFSSPSGHTLAVGAPPDGTMTVKPPGGPRPVDDLRCSQSGNEMVLTWSTTEPYEAVSVARSGGGEVLLPGDAVSHRDRPSPGPVSYAVRGVREGKRSVAARCEALVQPPRPAPPRDFSCTSEAGAVSLSWTNGEPYVELAVLRNGRPIALLEGGASSHADPFVSDLFTVYTLKARASWGEALPSTCILNEGSGLYVLRAEEVAASPGAQGVAVRIFGTCPEESQGVSVGLRLDPSRGRIRRLIIEGTALEPYYTTFAFQRHVLDQGETGAGVQVLNGTRFPRLADQHVLTVLVDLSPGVPSGTVVPLALGEFGSPGIRCVFAVEGRSREAQAHSGAILVGDSPVPPVEGAQAQAVEEATPKGSAAAPTRTAGILLAWRAAGSSAVAIERDGVRIGTVPGDRSEHLDRSAGPGIHHYRLTAQKDGKESFPVTVTSHPRGIPGTFIRGDSTADGALDISDALLLLRHLFLGGPQPGCLDAADTDDSGAIDLTDPLGLLFHLFLGGGRLPSPGPAMPWFDPTPDELPCG